MADDCTIEIYHVVLIAPPVSHSSAHTQVALANMFEIGAITCTLLGDLSWSELWCNCTGIVQGTTYYYKYLGYFMLFNFL